MGRLVVTFTIVLVIGAIGFFVLETPFEDDQPQPLRSAELAPQDAPASESAAEQQAGDGLPSAFARKSPKVSTSPGSKVASQILRAIDQIESDGITPDNAAERGFEGRATRFVRIDRDLRLQVYLHTTGYGEAAEAALSAVGAEIELVNEDISVVQAWVPIARMAEVAEMSFVNRVTPPDYAVSRSGSVVTEGDAILRADLARQLGVDGLGVKVGVISDGANDRTIAASLGELPDGIQAYGSCSFRSADPFSCLPAKTCNEGTAILEIIHDIAPRAELAIASAGTSLEFIQRLSDLVSIYGAHVVVDDLGFFAEPYFADGPIAQAVDDLPDSVVYISSAGNSAGGHYEGQYRTVIVDGTDLHDFGSTAGRSQDHTMDIVVEPGRFIVPVLQWNDRFGASANDYDLYLVNQTETGLLCPQCASEGLQSGSEDPIEGICYYNGSGASVRGKIGINLWSGVAKRIELFVIAGSPAEYNDPAGSIFGHAAVDGVISVGAIAANDPGNDTIEWFSSRGPSRIDFPALETRETPVLTAIDGVSVSGTGGFPDVFYGTSASAPHVAGIAALVKEIVSAAVAEDVVDILTTSAIDLGAQGRDRTYGWGRVDALNAVTSIDSDDDGTSDLEDDFPNDPGEQKDSDDDGVGDNADDFPNDPSETSDRDGDGVGDNSDAFPDDSSESSDNDQDGVGDNADTDDDNDGLSDEEEAKLGSDQYDSDSDNDTMPDGLEVAEGYDPTEADCPRWYCGGMSAAFKAWLAWSVGDG